jgi:hypothetical protein
MDCKGWGSAGWILLHSTALCCDDIKNNISPRTIKKFFGSVRHILPCIYCRRSYYQYMKELSIDPFIASHNVFEWIYHIHNKVNQKLRSQGYCIENDPSLSSVRKRYISFNKKNKKVVGWEFFYCVVLNYPVYSEDISNARYKGHIDFFTSLAELLCPTVRDRYVDFFLREPIQKYMETRSIFSKWLYRLEKCLTGKSNKICSFEKKCERIERYRVEKCVGGTCRL